MPHFFEDDAEFSHASVEDGEGEFGIFFSDGDFCFGASTGHEYAGAELFEEEAIGFVGAVVSAEVADGEVVIGIHDDAGVIFEGKEGDIAMVELDGFFAEVATFIGGKDKTGGGVGFPEIFFSLREVKIEEGGGILGGLAIGSVGQFHLEEAKIEADLEEFPPFGGLNEAGVDFSGFERPGVEDGGDV